MLHKEPYYSYGVHMIYLKIRPLPSPNWHASKIGEIIDDSLPLNGFVDVYTLNDLIFAVLNFCEFREGQVFGYFVGMKFREFREFCLINFAKI